MLNGQYYIQDIRAAIDDIHVTSLKLKTTCLSDLEKYVKKDSRLAALLEKLGLEEKKTFLLTNSDWWFTSQIMTHLLGSTWTSYFSLIVVDACKPRFFSGEAEMTAVTTDQTSVPVFSGGNEVRKQNIVQHSRDIRQLYIDASSGILSLLMFEE